MAEKCFVLNPLFPFVVALGRFLRFPDSMFGTFALTTGDLGSLVNATKCWFFWSFWSAQNGVFAIEGIKKREPAFCWNRFAEQKRPQTPTHLGSRIFARFC